MELKGLDLLKAKTKHSISESIFIIKHMVVNDYPKEDMEDAVKRIKKSISDNYKWLGEDFCIDQGKQLEQIWNDYLKYLPNDKGI